MPIRIVISDTDNDHALAVRNCINFGYGSSISSDIEIRLESLSASLQYAHSSGTVIAVVRSTIGIEGYTAIAQDEYPLIQVFMPLGNNSHIELTALTAIPVIVSSGAGDTQNDTAYGKGLEFWDDDNDGNPNNDASSFSNGTICGRLLFIKDSVSCPWWFARYRARMTASGGGSWTLENGYGKINTVAAIAFVGEMPEDPYRRLPPPPVFTSLGHEKILAQGRLPNDATAIYVVPAGLSTKASTLVMVNTEPGEPNRTRISVNALSGGGARNVAPLDFEIEGSAILDEEINELGERDSVMASSTGAIDFTLYGKEELLAT